MDFAVRCPLVRRSRLIFGFCSSTRTFACRFLQTSPRGDSPCIIANPSPPSGWVEDLHLLAAEHARHTTKPPAAADASREANGTVCLMVEICFGSQGGPCDPSTKNDAGGTPAP